MQLIKNQKGLSLPEILIAVGLTAGASLVTMKLTQTSVSNEAFIKANGEIAKTLGVIQTGLNNPDNCRSMLEGYQLDGAPIPALRMKIVNRSTTPPSVTTADILVPGKNYQGFYLDNAPGATPIRLVTNSNFQSGTVADLVIQFKIRQLSLGGTDKTVEKKIPVYVKTNGTTVVSCGAVIADANLQAKEKFCNSLAGGSVTMWTSDGKCVLRSMDCPYGQIPKSMGKMGEFTCENVTTAIPVTQIFDTTVPPCNVGPGGVSIVSDGNGRLRLVCN